MFDFKNLFVLDLANNHQGDLDHGLEIIDDCSDIINKNNAKGAIKFQFRQLDTFIHNDFKNNNEVKHLNRFQSTKLNKEDYKKLFDRVKEKGLYTICTPFDEESVDIIENMKFDLIKVASCSAKDWPLLEKISQTNIPIIVSTGGLELNNIDHLVSFFKHRNCNFSIMHCVAIYPTPDADFYLNQIDKLKNRYPDIEIGWSTHENPDDYMPIAIAIAKGATIFERHVGKSNDKYSLNAYSSDKNQIDNWVKSAQKTQLICGTDNRVISNIEKDSLSSLKRGIYVKVNKNKGEILNKSDVYFAMPFQKNQIDSGQWKEGIVLTNNVSVNEPLKHTDVELQQEPDYLIIKKAIHEVKGMLAEAKIFLNTEFEVDYSHHYGVRKFMQYGVVIINIINRDYCKKILVQLPNQIHPPQYHKLKEESFQVLSGSLKVTLDDKEKTLFPGDICLILPGVWHSFTTDTGCIFEEISTTHFTNDSVYKDKKINSMKLSERKTKVNHWGRYEIKEYL
ncbi:N-acetylneuraminate synthase family protein [Alphaproteobacteria bacterium]|nr:N-acetylneuraminate synthase family protein [Alphaproteobacteria bacterium]